MTDTYTISIGASTARIVRMLAPRPWEADADAVSIAPAPSGRGFVCTFTRAYAPRLIAQLDCADVSAARRARNVTTRPAPRTTGVRADRVNASTGRATCPHPFRDGCPDGPWTCFTCGHVEPGTCTSDHGPESR